MTLSPRKLTAQQLRRRCDTGCYDFKSTADVPDLDGIIGQERAARAIEFGIEIPYPGYNIFATGPAGTGKTSIITRFLERKALTRETPPDWGYVHNMATPDQPRPLRLPPRGGCRLRDQMDSLLAQVAEALPGAFSSDQYAEHRNQLEGALDSQRNALFKQLDQAVKAQGFALVQTPMGLVVAPVKEGKPLTQEQFQALPEDERETFSNQGRELQTALERTLREIGELEEAAQERLNNLDQEIAAATIRPFFEKLTAEYADWPDVLDHLGGVESHIAEQAGDFKEEPGKAEEKAPAPGQRAPFWAAREGSSPLDRYRINVVVDNKDLQGAPVILETNPTYTNLIGRVEQRAEFGALVTDYRYIKAGALQRANGGYLVMDARVLLRQPLAWEALKQALRNKRVRIEEPGQQLGVLATTTLTPGPIPVDVKVVLIGDPDTYYLLHAADEQFEKLFKVRADFAVEMDWTPDNEEKFVRFIRHQCQEADLPNFDVSAICRVVEYGARSVEDQRKLTTRFARVTDIVQETAFWAQQAGRRLATAEDVDKAIEMRVERANQYEVRLREKITDGTIMVDVTGEVVGQVNGLAVLQLGDYAFGRPSRITAQTYLGRAGVISIEREAKLSGRIHDKGMLILAGFLGGRFAQDKPLSLSASIAFEQSYSGIDGDSASSAELCALLSSLSGLPIKQGIAVTGSVNQRGEVQVIGGATVKIEGYFDVCKAHPDGLAGEQGVILPAANAPNLMLREDVIAAVEQGTFSIYPVRTIDEGIQILTGVQAGERAADGQYPADSVNGRVDRQLRDLALRLQQFGRPERNDAAGKGEEKPEEDEAQGEDTPGEPDLPGDQPEPEQV